MFSEEEESLKKYIKSMAKRELDDYANRSLEDEEFPQKKLEQLYNDGFFNMILDEEYDGLGMSLKESIIIINEIGKVDPQIAHLLEGVNYGVNYPFAIYGTEEQKHKYLKRTNGDKMYFGLLAFNEPNGSGHGQIETVATKKGDYYELSGVKSMITNASYADFGLIFARDSEEKEKYSLFIVDLKNNPNVKIGKPERTMGLGYVKISDINLKNALVHKSNILGKEGQGFEILAKSMELVRLGIAAVAESIAEKALAEAVMYMKNRKISTKPMKELQAAGFKIGQSKVDLEIMKSAIFSAVEGYNKEKRNYLLDNSIVKYFATEKAKSICDECFQLCGGMAYISNGTIEKLYRDIRLFTIIGGTSETILDMVSKYTMV